jgi:hypothetical protein
VPCERRGEAGAGASVLTARPSRNQGGTIAEIAEIAERDESLTPTGSPSRRMGEKIVHGVQDSRG